MRRESTFTIYRLTDNATGKVLRYPVFDDNPTLHGGRRPPPNSTLTPLVKHLYRSEVDAWSYWLTHFLRTGMPEPRLEFVQARVKKTMERRAKNAARQSTPRKIPYAKPTYRRVGDRRIKTVPAFFSDDPEECAPNRYAPS